MSKWLFVLLFLPLSYVQAQGIAEDYPVKPVILVIPGEGAVSVDGEFRLFTQSILETTGKQFVIESRAGAAGVIGTAYVAKAAPDGYTILGANSSFTLSPGLHPNIPYDNVRDFAPIILLDKRVFVLVVHPSTGFTSLAQYLAYARANPGKLNYGTNGPGASTHMPGALLHQMTNTQVTFVHYKASSQRLVDLMAGRIQAATSTIITNMANFKAGKLRPLGVTGSQRVSIWPDMPTIAEQGVPGYEVTSWIGLLAPAKTPTAMIAKLNALFIGAGKDPKVTKKIEADGTQIMNSTPEQFRDLIVTETVRWKKVIQDMGIRPDD